MELSRRPWITAGIALAGAGLLAVPQATPPLGVAAELFRLTSNVEFDMSQLISATAENLDGVKAVFSGSNWATDPDIGHGFTTLVTDVLHDTANPVTSPVSLLTEGALGLLGVAYGPNAALTAAAAVFGNVESALGASDYSAILSALQAAPTTLAYAFLDGYPQAVGSELFSPQFGLLTNTSTGAATGSLNALQQISNTLADQVSALGGGQLTTTPTLLEPGSVDMAVNMHTLLHEIAPSGTLTLPFSIDSLLEQAAPSGSLDLPFSLDDLINHAAPSGTIDLGISLNDLINHATPGGTIDLGMSLNDLLAKALPDGVHTSVTVHVFGHHTVDIHIPLSEIEHALGHEGSKDITISTGSLKSILGDEGSKNITISTGSLESILGDDGSKNISIPISDLESMLGSAGSEDISIPVSDLESVLPSTLTMDFDVSEVTGSAVPDYDVDLSQDLLAVLGSIAPVSSSLPALLGTDPTIDVLPLFADVANGLGLPVSIVGGDLPANLTGIGAELFSSLVP